MRARNFTPVETCGNWTLVVWNLEHIEIRATVLGKPWSGTLPIVICILLVAIRQGTCSRDMMRCAVCLVHWLEHAKSALSC